MTTKALTSLCLSLILSAGAMAQPSINALAGSTSLSAADTQAISAYVAQAVPNLAGEPEAMRLARQAILAPLAQPSVSVAFRLELAKGVLPAITPLISDERDINAANALRIAGELATSNSLELIQRSIKTDKRISVRVAAALGYRLAFDAVARSERSALGTGELSDAIRTLGEIIAKETDANLLDAATAAMLSAVAIPPARAADIQTLALSTLSASLEPQTRRLNDQTAALAPVILRGLGAGRSALTTLQPGAPVGQSALKELATFSGCAIAAADRILTANPDSPLKATLEQVVGAAENNIFLVRSNLGGSTPPSVNLATLIRTNKLADFSKGAQSLLTTLSAEPLSIPADKFKP
jgi:hypothetical protein